MVILKTIKKLLFITICIGILITGITITPALAANKGNFELVIGGLSEDKSSGVVKTVNNQDGTVVISGTTAGSVNMWAQMKNSSGTSRSDAILAKYRKKVSLTNNLGLKNHYYYLYAHRENIWDSTQTFTGTWSPDEY